MKIPTQKKLMKNDFPEDDQALVEQLSGIIDYNTEKVFAVLNKNVSFGDNVNGLVKEIDIIVNSSGIPTVPVKIPSTLTPARPVGAIVINQRNLTNSTTYPTSGISITYTESAGIITIEHVTGLPANNTFRLNVVFLA